MHSRKHVWIGLKQIMKKNTVEEEREVIEKALFKSDMLEVSKDGLLIHNKDIKSERVFTACTVPLVPPAIACLSLQDATLYHRHVRTAWKCWHAPMRGLLNRDAVSVSTSVHLMCSHTNGQQWCIPLCKGPKLLMCFAAQHNVAMMIVVAGALLNDEGQVLVSQRKQSQSFPGMRCS